MDPLTISTGLATAQTIFELIKRAKDSLVAAGKTELTNELIEIQLQMMELLTKHQHLIDENHSLRRQNQQLKEEIELNAVIKHHHGCYWVPKNDGKYDGPYSTLSWDTDKKLVLLHREANTVNRDGEEFTVFRCHKSKNPLSVPNTFIKANASTADWIKS